MISAILAKAGKCSRVNRGTGNSRKNCFNREEMSDGLRPSNENVPETKLASISSSIS